MKISVLVFAVAIWLAAMALAQSPTSNDAGKDMDDFFNNPHLQAFSGCDSSAWNAIHVDVVLGLQRRELPPARAKDDMATASAIYACLSTIDDKALKVDLALGRGISDMETESTDSLTSTTPNSLFPGQIVDDIQTKVRPTFREFQTLEDMKAFATGAARDYEEHATKTQYEELVARYNALVGQYNARVNPPNGQRPVSLHCESSTTPWGVTTTDCR